MNEKINSLEAAQFFVDAKATFAGLQHYFELFRTQVEKNAVKNPYFDWKVSALTDSGRSFEVKYMTLRVRAVFSIRPAVDQRGVITFYLLDDFEPSAKVIDFFDYDAEYGMTSVRDRTGSEMYIEHHSHHLMTQIFYQAYKQA